MSPHRHTFAEALLFFLLTACCILSLTSELRADDEGRFTILEENDSLFFNSDKHYTQGLRLSNLIPTLDRAGGRNDVFEFVDRNAPFPRRGGDRRVAVF